MHSDQRTAFTPRPLALLAAGLAVGIMVAHLMSLPLTLLLCCSVLSCSVAVWSLRKRHYSTASIFVVLIAVFAGATLTTIERRGAPADQIKQLFAAGTIDRGDPVELTGVLEGPPEIAPESLYLKLRVERMRLKNVERPASGVVELMAPARDEW